MLKNKVWYVFFGLVLLSLLTPFWAFYEMFFPYITSKAFYFRIIVEAALPLYVYLIVVEKALRPRLKNPLNILLLAFLAINVITAFTGVNVARSLWGNFERMGGVWYLAHLTLWAFYVQALGQKSDKYLRWFLQTFLAVTAVIALNGVSGWLKGPTLTIDPSLPDRVSSTLGNPIFFASMLILPAALAGYLALQETRVWLKITYWAGMALMLLGVYLSGTRGAFVGILMAVLAAGIAYAALSKNRKRAGIVVIILVAVLAIGCGLFVNKSKLDPASTASRLVNLKDSNSEARLLQWQIALQGFKKYPVLGVGSENYYVIFDEFYNPELYKYDPSWFDKPHNYILEVLVTNGIFGLLIYAAMFVAGFYALYRAYKSELLGLGEMCFLAAGFIAYQIQNLFVFDTVSASVAFFTFIGFCTYMLHESQQEASSLPAENKTFSPAFAGGLLVVLCLVMMFVEYASNIASLQAAKRVNFGMAYTSYDPAQAAGYFESALSVPYNMDPRETANRYSDFGASLMQASRSNPKISTDFVSQQLEKVSQAQIKITEKVGNDPVMWMHVATNQMNTALLHATDINVARAAVDKAISLSPKRVEILQLRVQLAGFDKNWADLVFAAQKIANLNPYRPDLRWQLAMGYYLNQQLDMAVKEGDQALAEGYKFTQLQQFAWYLQYYLDQKNWAKAAPLLEQAVSLEPNEIGLYVDLIQAYANLGDMDHAQTLAKQILQADPSQKANIDKILKNAGK